VPPVSQASAAGQQTNPQAPAQVQPTPSLPVQPASAAAAAASAGPNANPLNLFPQVCLCCPARISSTGNVLDL
jgi:UV excision repair protein RAD23